MYVFVCMNGGIVVIVTKNKHQRTATGINLSPFSLVSFSDIQTQNGDERKRRLLNQMTNM